MGEPSLTSVLDCLHRVVGPAAQREVSDGELLERFARTRDEAAFELLVWRHGPMVLALCRRLLGQEQDAEDALQATFLVLVRKAGSIKKKQSLASWLYKVAHRIANRARLHAARLRAPVPTSDAAVSQTRGAVDTETDAIWRELREKLDGEIAQLPEKYRRPLILCYLEGKTHEEAARLLGCPKGTLASQVARARDRLHARLTRRGWEFPSGVMTALLAERASAGPIAAELVHATVRSALAYASGQTAAVVSAKAAGMAEGALRLMWYGKMKIIGGVLLAVVVGATGVGLATRELWAANETEDVQTAQVGPREGEQQTAPKAPRGFGSQTSKKDIAVLRQEIAELREGLAAALREIRALRATLRPGDVPPADEPLYRGQPARFWLEQFKDADAEYRKEAVKAVGALAQRNKALVPAVVSALKDPSSRVSHEAILALRDLPRFENEVIPTIGKILKSSGSALERERATEVLATVGGKAAVQLLAEAVRDEDWHVRHAAALALRGRESSASSAIPALVDTLEDSLDAGRGSPGTGLLSFGVASPAYFLGTLLSIDPQVKDILPGNLKVGDRMSIAASEMPSWRQALDALRKTYPKRE